MPVALRCSAQRPSWRRRYRVELSIDPWFPKVPAAPGFPLQPSHVAVRSEAILCGTGCALAIRPQSRTGYRLSLDNRSLGHFLPGAVSVSPNLIQLRWLYGLGRRRELHPPAPFAAAPALLEACGYSVCLVPGWRPETCRDGVPACPFERVCLQFGGLLAEPSASRPKVH